MKTTTIYRVSTAPDDWCAINSDAISEHVTAMREQFDADDGEAEYDVEILYSFSNNRMESDGDYAISYEVPEDLAAAIRSMAANGPPWWSEVVRLAESIGYEEACTGNKFGTRDYRFEKPEEE